MREFLLLSALLLSAVTTPAAMKGLPRVDSRIAMALMVDPVGTARTVARKVVAAHMADMPEAYRVALRGLAIAFERARADVR